MRFARLVTIPIKKAQKLEGLCKKPLKKFPPNQVAYQLEIDLGDFLMRIQIMSPEEPDKNCWTHAILFRKVNVNGFHELVEAGRVPRGKKFLRRYFLSFVGNDFIVTLRSGNIQKIKVKVDSLITK